MMADESTKKRLGRGLAALIGDIENSPVAKMESVSVPVDRVIAIEKIRANPNNPRRIFLDSELQELTNSIEEHGIVQPILVRPLKGEDFGGAKYEIIAGERRWRASQKAGLHEIPALVREVEDRQALEIAIIENVQRADLNAVEEAMGYDQLMGEYDYTQNDLAKVIGKSRSHVANTLRLLKLPGDIRDMVSGGELSAGHARALITSEHPESLAKKIIAEGLSVRQTESLAQKIDENRKLNNVTKITAEKSTDIIALEKRLSDVLGMKIGISHRSDGSGKLQVSYKSLDQLDAICHRIDTK